MISIFTTLKFTFLPNFLLILAFCHLLFIKISIFSLILAFFLLFSFNFQFKWGSAPLNPRFMSRYSMHIYPPGARCAGAFLYFSVALVVYPPGEVLLSIKRNVSLEVSLRSSFLGPTCRTSRSSLIAVILLALLHGVVASPPTGGKLLPHSEELRRMTAMSDRFLRPKKRSKIQEFPKFSFFKKSEQ